MITAVLLQILQSLVVLAFGPLFAGVLARAEAIVASKRGPSVLQPYRNLAKWLRKASAAEGQSAAPCLGRTVGTAGVRLPQRRHAHRPLHERHLGGRGQDQVRRHSRGGAGRLLRRARAFGRATGSCSDNAQFADDRRL